MLDAANPPHPSHHLSLKDWVYQVLGLPDIHLRFRLRGNDLHILCEGEVCPPGAIVVSRLMAALKQCQGLSGFSIQGGPVYQIILYGRSLEQTKPHWTHSIWLSQLTETDSTPANSANLPLEGIAQALSQTLSSWGISVKVASRDLPPTRSHSPAQKRLWVLCECNYSVEESLLAEPITECLRSLTITEFREAVVCSQVTGESQPDWRLRVDLTPQEEMLREWAHWGDVQAITRLLERALAATETQVKAVLKDSTLHLFCRHCRVEAAGTEALAGTSEPPVPSQSRIRQLIAPLLTELSPQGIQGATLYGVKQQGDETQADPDETPVWIDWLDLPASHQPALTADPLTLAQQGNLQALQFLLERLVNPDLDRRLAMGGIDLQVRRKQDLLHILSEAIVPPQKSQVALPLARFLKSAGISGVSGIRIYGRRAGKSDPAWTYGLDFIHRKRLVPEAAPEFAATDRYVEDLLASPDQNQTEAEEVSSQLTVITHRWGHTLRLRLQQMLCASQLVVPTLEVTALAPLRDRAAVNLASYSQSAMVTAVWSVLGLLLVIQTDWLLSRLSNVEAAQPPIATMPARPSPTPQESVPQLSLQKSQGAKAEVFNASGFTRQGDLTLTIEEIEAKTADRPKATKAAILAAAQSNNPSFNNRLLDEKLALYQQQLQKNPPPDVLIVGSSRALRGIDPQALEEALAAQGYNNVQAFNFGINGATAQTVDLQIRRLLKPQQLPKLIIWADGARAFNSGRVDETYNAMRKSPAYQALMAGTFLANQGTETTSTPEDASSAKLPTALTNGYDQLNQWLNERLASLSSSYEKRDRIKTNLQSSTKTWLENWQSASPSTLPENPDLDIADQTLDLDGFLPITVRYNPASYYQKYAKVTGAYDRDYESFRMEGEQSKALLSLMQFANTHQIKIVFINLPLTQDYLDPTRRRYEEQFQQYMQRFAAQTGLIFRDLSQSWPTQYDYFSDPSHLNRYGAYEVSQAIAKDPLIPWPSK